MRPKKKAEAVIAGLVPAIQGSKQKPERGPLDPRNKSEGDSLWGHPDWL